MKKLLLFLALILATLLAAGAARANATAAWTAKTDPALLAATADGATAEFLVVLDAQADLSGAARLGDKAARGRYVYETLTAVAARTQAPCAPCSTPAARPTAPTGSPTCSGCAAIAPWCKHWRRGRTWRTSMRIPPSALACPNRQSPP